MLGQWQLLKSMLVDEALGKFVGVKGHRGCFAVLKEDDPSSRLPTVLLGEVPADAVLVKTDFARTEPEFLEAGLDLRRRCDYVLFTEIDGRPVVVHFELKSTVFSLNQVKRQMKGTDCLLEYLSAVARRLLDRQLDIMDNDGIQHRYVLIHVPDKPMKFSKTGKMPGPRIGHDSPENVFCYPMCSGGRGRPSMVRLSALIKL